MLKEILARNISSFAKQNNWKMVRREFSEFFLNFLVRIKKFKKNIFLTQLKNTPGKGKLPEFVGNAVENESPPTGMRTRVTEVWAKSERN